MPGIFQVDLPIGRFLWLMCVVIVLVGILSGGLIGFSENPIDFLTQILLLVGSALTIYILISSLIMLPSIVVFAVGYSVVASLQGKTPKTTVNHHSGYLRYKRVRILMPFAMLLAMILAIQTYKTPFLMISGVVGLFLVLIAYLFQNEFESVDLVELRSEAANSTIVKLYIQGKERILILETDLMSEVSRLINMEWEIIELNNLSETQFAILKKKRFLPRFFEEEDFSIDK